MHIKKNECSWSAASSPLSINSRSSLHSIYCFSVFNVWFPRLPRGCSSRQPVRKREDGEGVSHSWPSPSCKWHINNHCSHFTDKAISIAMPKRKGGWEITIFPARVLCYNKKGISFWWRASSLCYNSLGASRKNPFTWLVVISATNSSICINNHLQRVFFSLVWPSFQR